MGSIDLPADTKIKPCATNASGDRTDIEEYRDLEGGQSPPASTPPPAKTETVAGAKVVAIDRVTSDDKGLVQIILPGGEKALRAYPDEILTPERFNELMDAMGVPAEKREVLEHYFKTEGIQNFGDLQKKLFRTPPGYVLKADSDVDKFCKMVEQYDSDPSGARRIPMKNVMGFPAMKEALKPPKTMRSSGLQQKLSATFNSIPAVGVSGEPKSEHLKGLNKEVPVTKALAEKAVDAAKNGKDLKEVFADISEYLDAVAGDDNNLQETLMLALTKEVQESAIKQDFPEGQKRFDMLRALGEELHQEFGAEEGTQMYAMGLCYLGKEAGKLFEEGEHDHEKQMKKFTEEGNFGKMALPEDQGGEWWNLSKHYDHAFHDNWNSDNSWNILRDNGNVLKKNGKLS